jgi:Tol biopolymer transport system component
MRTPMVAVTLLVLLGVPSYAAAAPAPLDPAPSAAGLVVWTNRADDGRERLMIAAADGSGRRVLTRPGPETIDFDAQFSPDGEWIAYERDTPDSATVRLVRPDGTDGHRVKVPCADPCVAVAGPTWLSNRRLAVVRVLGPFSEDDTAAEALLWSIRTDGTGLRRLSPPSAAGRFEDSYAHPSRDGDYRVFTRLRLSDGASTVFRVDRDGTGLQRLLPWGLGVEINDLSTAAGGLTGGLVVFEAYGRGDPEATFVDLGVVPATCASPKACREAMVWLTDNASSGRRNANPHWSPDGRNLVFTDRESIEVDDAEIWTMRYSSGERRRISSSPRFDYRPDWGRG